MKTEEQIREKLKQVNYNMDAVSKYSLLSDIHRDLFRNNIAARTILMWVLDEEIDRC